MPPNFTYSIIPFTSNSVFLCVAVIRKMCTPNSLGFTHTQTNKNKDWKLADGSWQIRRGKKREREREREIENGEL